MAARYTGPYLLVSKPSPYTAVLEHLITNTLLKRPVNISRLKRGSLYNAPQNTILSPDDNPEDEVDKKYHKDETKQKQAEVRLPTHTEISANASSDVEDQTSQASDEEPDNLS